MAAYFYKGRLQAVQVWKGKRLIVNFITGQTMRMIIGLIGVGKKRKRACLSFAILCRASIFVALIFCYNKQI
jgi:hypothetical protein